MQARRRAYNLTWTHSTGLVGLRYKTAKLAVWVSGGQALYSLMQFVQPLTSAHAILIGGDFNILQADWDVYKQGLPNNGGIPYIPSS